MSVLIITKQTGNFFSLVLDGGTPIISEQNRLTTIGDLCNFKTANGANLILKQNIHYSEITVIASGSFTFLSVSALWNKLIEINFFDGTLIAPPTGITRFDQLIDTFSYIGRDGQVVVVNESELKLETQAISLFTQEDQDKLDEIQEGAEVNVQVDWNESNPASDKYILNKPNLSGFGMVDFPRLIAPQQDFELLENPYAINTYRKLKEYYLEKGLLKEAEAFEKIIIDYNSNSRKES